jgi:hypothetical protein
MFSILINGDGDFPIEYELKRNGVIYEIYYPNQYEDGQVVDEIAILHNGKLGQHILKTFKTENCPQHPEDEPLKIHLCKMLYYQLKLYQRHIKDVADIGMELVETKANQNLLDDLNAWWVTLASYSSEIAQNVHYAQRFGKIPDMFKILRRETEECDTEDETYSPLSFDTD